MQCPRCGANVPNGATACGNCGAQFQQGKRCPNCQNVIPANAAVCPKCGARFTAQPAAPMPFPQKTKSAVMWRNVLIAVLIFILGFGLGSISSGRDKPKTSPRAESSPSSFTKKENAAPQSSSGESKIESAPVIEEENSSPDSEELYKITYETCSLSLDSSGDVECNVVIEIENTSNSILYLGSPVYDFEDASGKLLGTCDTFAFGSSDPCLIAPGEKGYFYSNRATVDGDISIDDDYVFVPHLDVEKSIYDEIIEYEISDITMSEGSRGPCSIIGRVSNNTKDDAPLVWICLILYDAEGRPLGISGTNVTDLNAGDSKSFSTEAFPIDGVSFEDIADYKVFARKFVIQ